MPLQLNQVYLQNIMKNTALILSCSILEHKIIKQTNNVGPFNLVLTAGFISSDQSGESVHIIKHSLCRNRLNIPMGGTTQSHCAESLQQITFFHR